MTTTDSLLGIATAFSGFALIRFPTGRNWFRRTEQGLSGCADALCLRAAALYTIPAFRTDSVAGLAFPDRRALGKGSR